MMTEAPTPTLTAEDRCDRCGAQAYVVYDLNGLPLLMCAHHDREHGFALIQKGAILTVDNTAELTKEV